MGSRVGRWLPSAGWGAVLAAALVVPVAFTRQLADPFMAPKATLLWAAAVVAGLSLAASASAQGGWPLPRLRARWPVALLLGWTALATILSPTPWTALWGAHGRNDGLLTLLAVSVLGAALVAATWRAPARLSLLVGALIAGAVLGLVVVVVERLGWGIGWELQGTTGGVVGLGGNPNFSGAHLALVVPLVLAARLAIGERWARAALVALAVALAAGVWLTETRAGLLALVGGVALAGVLVPEVLPRLVRAASIVATVALLGLIVVASVAPTAIDRPELAGSEVLAVGGLRQRTNIWDATVTVIAEHPLVGVGPDGLGRVEPRARSSRGGSGLIWADEAHDVALDRAASAGLPALGALLWLLAVTGAGAWRGRRRLEPEHRWLLAGFGGLLGGYLLQGAFSIDTIPLLLLATCGVGALLALTDPAVLDRRAAPDPAPDPDGAPSPVVTWVGLALSLVLLVGIARPAVADRQHRRAQQALAAGEPLRAVAADGTAASWAGHEPVYRRGQAEALIAAAAAPGTDPALRRTLLDEALLAYDAALAASPDDVRLLVARARAQALAAAAAGATGDDDAALGHLDEAEASVRLLLDELEATDDLHLLLGELLEARARLLDGGARAAALDEAASQLERAADHRPDRADALVGLARVRLAQGRDDEARELLVAARREGVASDELDAAIEELDERLAGGGG